MPVEGVQEIMDWLMENGAEDEEAPTTRRVQLKAYCEDTNFMGVTTQRKVGETIVEYKDDMELHQFCHTWGNQLNATEIIGDEIQ